MDMIKVVCAIIYSNEKIFLCRRKPEKSLGGFWEFPGGKVEIGEGYVNSLKRELMEELWMEIEIEEYFDSSQHDYEEFSIELIAYSCKLKSWDMHLTDHDLFEWVSPNEILNWKLAPADITLAQKIKKIKAV